MRSDVVKKGVTRTAHRTLFHAMGYSDEDLQKPLIGVVNAFNEIIPGHIHLREIAQAVSSGHLGDALHDKPVGDAFDEDELVGGQRLETVMGPQLHAHARIIVKGAFS